MPDRALLQALGEALRRLAKLIQEARELLPAAAEVLDETLG
jgi:hypothetical protein